MVRKKKAGSAGGMMASGDEVERQVDALEGQKVEVERALAEAYHKRDYQRGEKLSQQLKMLDARIEGLYERL